MAYGKRELLQSFRDGRPANKKHLVDANKAIQGNIPMLVILLRVTGIIFEIMQIAGLMPKTRAITISLSALARHAAVA